MCIWNKLSKNKNFQELLLIFNLHALFAVSLYTASNSIAVNTLVGIVMIQCIILALYDINLHRKVKVVSHFITLLLKLKLAKCFNFVWSQPPQTQQDIRLHNSVPEVTFN